MMPGGRIEGLTHTILFVSYAAAIGAIAPYWMRPVDPTGSSAVALAAESISHILGFYSYLWEHPRRAVAAAPAILITLTLILKPILR